MKIEVTKEMLLEAVATAGAQQDLADLVTETLSKQMSDYFSRDCYGSTQFQRAVQKFIDEIAMDILRSRRAEIEESLRNEIVKHLDEYVLTASRHVVERIIAKA